MIYRGYQHLVTATLLTFICQLFQVHCEPSLFIVTMLRQCPSYTSRIRACRRPYGLGHILTYFIKSKRSLEIQNSCYLQYILYLFENEEVEWDKFGLLKWHAENYFDFPKLKAALSALLKGSCLLHSRLRLCAFAKRIERPRNQASVEFCVCFSQGNDLRNISETANLCPSFVFQQVETFEGQDQATLV